MNANKNYNVDDILSEIKSRKLREKTQAPEPKSADEDFHLDFSPREPAVKTEPRPEPKPEPRPIPRPEPRPMPKPEPAPEPVPVPVPRREPVPEPKPMPVPQPRPEPQPRRKQAVQPRETARTEPDDFEFKMPDLGGEKPHNPLGFDGEARSITERAKLRGGLPGSRAAVNKFEFKPVEELEPPDESGFSFKGFSELEDMPLEASVSENTRVLPDITGMRDFSVREPKAFDEKKKPDFGKFSLDRPFYDDSPSDGLPEGSVVDYSEYNSTSDRRDVQRDIAKVKLWLFIRASVTLVLTGMLLAITLAGKYSSIPLPEFMWPEVESTVRMYYIICTALTILVALANSSAVGGGLMGLFKMHSNSDTLAACAILAAVGQGVAVVADPKAVDPASLSLYFSVASLAMLFNSLGKMTLVNRILANFRILASEQPKKALVAADSDEFCHEFFKNTIRRPVIAHGVKANFFTDFLGLSYSDKYDVGVNRVVAPVCLAGALIVGAVTLLFTGSTLFAMSALTAVLCVCATLSSTFIENVPLSKLTKRLAPQGGMVSGNKAVEDFCDVKAIILTENDLFPRGNVQLHGIKAFSQKRIDEAILDAASVLCAMDGALGPIFLEMIGGNKKLLKKVDNIVFENAMGISAWVDSRRVLIGNRRLMLNHGISLPPEAAQAAKLSTESEPLFLSNSGEATAMFTVSYHIDEELAIELDQMAHREKLLIVHTTDANITADKIWELYGYPIELVRILPAEWHPAYQKLIEPRGEAVAEIVCAGDKASVMVKAILACMAARSSILSATVIQLIQIVFGYALVTFMAFMGSIETITVTGICAYQLFWFAAIFIVQKVRQS